MQLVRRLVAPRRRLAPGGAGRAVGRAVGRAATASKKCLFDQWDGSKTRRRPWPRDAAPSSEKAKGCSCVTRMGYRTSDAELIVWAKVPTPREITQTRHGYPRPCEKHRAHVPQPWGL